MIFSFLADFDDGIKLATKEDFIQKLETQCLQNMNSLRLHLNQVQDLSLTLDTVKISCEEFIICTGVWVIHYHNNVLCLVYVYKALNKLK